ncbi:MAG TPA: ABC transporter ATP-binding protein [Polyangiaceae bacterium]|jgi:NitT/TauT family transport system ATP-binding protein|nr:ABC transporter ATP-binding protein [Polyangiaceae bacterium]
MNPVASDRLELPSYRHHTEQVRRHLAEIAQRPVVLEVDQLARTFQGPSGAMPALTGIDLEVRRGEFVSVIGPSGCGKSTLIRILAGLDRPSSGGAFIDGVRIEGPGAERGMVFQGYTLFPWLSVMQNVMFGLRMKHVSKARAEEHARHWLKVIGLERFMDHYPAQLSGGMKQRVAIARALANEPRILLMDEPFGALDALTRCSMQKHLLEVHSQVDVTILFITHDLDEAIYLSDRIVVLGANPGRTLEVIDVPVTRPRSPEQFLTGHFLATKKRLEQLIHGTDDAMTSSQHMDLAC